MTKIFKEKTKRSVLGTILFWLPYFLILAMLIHCGILLIIEFSKLTPGKFPSTSFPWWAMPALVAIAYAFFIGISFIIWLIYYWIIKKANGGRGG